MSYKFNQVPKLTKGRFGDIDGKIITDDFRYMIDNLSRVYSYTYEIEMFIDLERLESWDSINRFNVGFAVTTLKKTHKFASTEDSKNWLRVLIRYQRKFTK